LESLWSKAQDGNKNKEEKNAAREKIMKLTGTQKWSDGANIIKDEAQKIRDMAYSKAPKEVQDAVTSIREFAGKQTKSALKLAYYSSVDMSPKELDDAVNNTFKTAADRKFAKASHKIIKDCAKANGEITEECVSAGLAKFNPKKTGTKYVCKACVAAARIAKTAGYDVDTQLKEHYKIAEDAGNKLMKAIPKSKELLAGVMQKLAEAFPLKVCMDGTEFMLIDGVHITAKTLKSVFGVENYSDLNKGLTVVEINGETMLVFSAGSGKKQIPIGYVDARQKGKGSEGNIGFEILCNDEFVQKCSSANISNGDTSQANKKANERITKSIANREKNKKEKDLDNETDET
ncbi:hypothetical protein EBU94_08085, partial [bacterium]|nr:hypothetical protein [bacterium]